MEKLLPKRVQEVLIARKITLYWVDSTERSKLWESPDHLGYWTVYELLYHVGGTILPSETFSQHCIKAGETLLGSDKKLSSEPRFSSWISIMPTDSTLNRLLYNSPEYEASFPRMEGTLFLPVEGKEIQETWTVTLEPLTMHQRHFQKPVRIFLKGTVTQWSLPMSDTLGTDSWMLQGPDESKSTQRTLFQQLLNRLTAEELHLVASVDPGEGWPPISGVISPLSTNTTILTLFHSEEAEFQRHFLQTVVTENSQETASVCFDVKDVVLNQIHSLRKDPTASGPAAPPVPEWAQQELGRTAPWSPAVLERWFLRSALSGASSNLMESFWLLQAALSHKEEPSKTESELTRCLSELYLRKSREESAASNQEDGKKKRGVPRTPVRQKMNTMCRSLKMLNVARLNVKAQKLHPDGSPDATGEKGTQKTAAGRAADRLENRGRSLRSSKPKDFKTEEQLLSYIHENYQKTVAAEETVLYSCARNMISAIKAFLKAKGTQELEVNCLNQVKNNLLKTSKSLRQNIGKKLDKEEKVRECQLQVFLRLEVCLQCPSIQESVCDMEQVVEEANLLRMVCLTEDSAYLAKFLEEILGLYVDSIPKTLGSLYHSLGFVVPQQLVGVLPTDCFSDDSMTQESKSPLLSVPPTSSAHRSGSVGTVSDQLEELRTRSAKKRRKNALIRHKSIAEISQNLRQIEIPKVTKRATKNENSHPSLQQPPLPGKDTVQEVTKVRRNLFNQEISPSKRPGKRGLPRSHSVSAVEGLEGKLASAAKTRGHHRLLTKSVPETPVHKQISRRLLHRQIKGRSSDTGPDIDVVDESPEKGDEPSLRRSPRIKQLSLGKTKSVSFYSASQPKSRSVQRVHSFQQDKSDQRDTSPVQSIRSPKSLLFAAVSEKISPSEKGSARIKRPSRSTVDSETPTASETPKKSDWKSPSSSRTTLRGLCHTPQTLLCSPERLHRSPAAATPVKHVLSQSFKDSILHASESPPPEVTLQKGHSLPEAGASLLGKMPKTPERPGSQPPAFVPNGTGPPSVNSRPKSTSSPAVPVLSTAQTWRESPAPAGHCLQWSPRAAAERACGATASAGTPQGPQPPRPQAPGAAPPQPWKDPVLTAPDGPRDPTMTPSPPVSPKEPCNSPLCDISKSPLEKSFTESFPTGQRDGKDAQTSSHIATQLSCPAPSTPAKTSQTALSAIVPPPPPSKSGKRHRKTSNPEKSFLECQPHTSAAPRAGVTGNADARKDQKEVNAAPQPSPERHRDPGTGFGSDCHTASPWLVAEDTEYLSLVDGAEDHVSDDLQSDVSLVGGGKGLKMQGTDEPSLTNPGSPLSPPSSGPSSPFSPSCTLQHSAHKRRPQAAVQLESLASPRLPGAPGSPQTYEMELEMPASGLPKLRIKKVDASSLSEAEPPRRDEGARPGLSTSSAKAETAYMSPPCPRPSHSTPGKGGGQTYICRSCTPTHCPSSTPCPSQTDGGVPWTPSPKHSGKTTPDSIKDWPRRKRAVGCCLGPAAGRAAVATELSGCVSLLQPQGEEPGFGLGIRQTPFLGDFELEGVCQLPDQSPPRDSVTEAEEGFSGAQFGLGSRKRLLSAKGEAERPAKRTCDEQREGVEVPESEERSPSAGAPRLPATGDDEGFGSGSASPSGCAVRSCLSASGLQALTQSPLLFGGRTPCSRRRDPGDEDVDVFPPLADDSPFSQSFSRRRPISRTYTRKKLIS
ncbi:hypothetical protein PAL_GLEAN10009482 [Pteropus alecto]|uniref:Uncharacterized protein n=1 Tax=Pteropus alecto TaxID=9402 RepID=L5L3P3_PTEAL|nr:hypothetical protein PAL_GLEAN10009482 [Pteropus alecto]